MANYLQTIENIYQGNLVDELNEQLTELVKACELTLKQGSITLEIKIKAQGNTGQMEIKPAVKTKIPQHERGTAIMFATPEHNLTLQDPRQGNLNLKVLEKTQQKIKKIGE